MEDSAAPILLYDGVCGFCNKSVQIILDNDKSGAMRFAPLQSNFGKSVIAKHPDLSGVDSIVLYEPSSAAGGERVSVLSTAVLRIAAYLGGLWKLCLIAYVIPRPIRDSLYDLFAKYRYRIFGKYDTCRIPVPEARSRFMD